MHNRLPPKGMCSGLRDVFTFLEITDNISETMQEIVVMED